MSNWQVQLAKNAEDDKIVTVVRIMYGGRDIDSILDEMLEYESE